MAIMSKRWAFTHNGLLLCRLFIALLWGCAELVGECIQGLVLLGNQWLLFVELGGFVNNALFMSRSACLSANVPAEFLFVCWFFFFLCWLCLWIRVSEHNPLIVCHVQTVQGVFLLLFFVFLHQAHVSISVTVCVFLSEYTVRVQII